MGSPNESTVGYFAVRACNKNIRPGKGRSKEASFGCESVWSDQRIADQRSNVGDCEPAFKRLNTRNVSCHLSQSRSPPLNRYILFSFLRQDLWRATGVFSPCLSPVYRLARKRHLTKFSPSSRQGRMESGLDRAQTWPGHVTTTFVSPQTAARRQTVEKTGELWMSVGEMILHILSLVSTLCLLPSGWLKRSGLLGTPELPINILLAVFWLRWQKKGKCRYLDPIPFCRIIWLLLTAQLSAAEAKAEISPVPGSSCFTRQFNQFGWKWH